MKGERTVLLLPLSQNRVLQFFRNFLKDRIPVSRFGLANEGHGRIPRRIIPFRQIEPVCVVRKQIPDRTVERAGEMGYRAVRHDHQIKLFKHRGRISEIVQVRT